MLFLLQAKRSYVVAGKSVGVVAIAILSDCFCLWLVAEERYRLYPQLPNVFYRLRSSA